MVGILDLLQTKSENVATSRSLGHVDLKTTQKAYKTKAQRQQLSSADVHVNGASSFGVTSKLKDINKRIKLKTNAKEDISKMDPEYIHSRKLEYFDILQKSVGGLRVEMEKTTNAYEKQELQDKIRRIENREEEISYLLDTVHILKRYVDPVENEQETDELVETIQGPSFSGFVVETRESAIKDKISQEYIAALDPQGYRPTEKDLRIEEICLNCQSTNFQFDNSFLFCVDCGHALEGIHDIHHLSFKENASLSILNNPTYKRINHFTEWLNSVTNKSSSIVPESIVQAIQMEMTKDRLDAKSEMDKRQVRLYLKRLGQSKFYDSTAAIISKISGQTSLELPEELTAQLREMFILIQAPFEKSKPSFRSSFLSYSYTIHQMLRLLEYDEFLWAFPLLKSREKLIVQDQIWENICEILDWKYLATV